MNLQKCILTNNDCYKKGVTINPIGIVVHSTGANNPHLKRYVQPDDGKLGKNVNNNHWNMSGTKACVHAFIGKLADGTIATYQTLPWNYKSWGCGTGAKGSYNGTHIQFEICEDGLTDESYFRKVYQEAVELCAYLIKCYPSIKIENVVCHQEAHQRGYASNHIDAVHWFSKFGKSMDDFRKAVAAQQNPTIGTAAYRKHHIVKVGDTLIGIGKKYGVDWKLVAKKNGLVAPYVITPGQIIVIEESGTQSDGSYRAIVNTKNTGLNVRAGAGQRYKVVRSVAKGSILTITEEKNGWGRLADGGWICLKYVKETS